MDNVTYDFITDRSVLKKYVGTSKKVVIPDRITEIGDSAFKGNYNVQTVELGKSVTRIHEEAFAECRSLTTVKCEEEMAFTPSRTSSCSSGDMIRPIQTRS